MLSGIKTNPLSQWRDRIGLSPISLLIQIGTIIIYKVFISLLFEYDLNVDRIIEKLSIIHDKEIIVGKTLVIFDEIQACPKAIT